MKRLLVTALGLALAFAAGAHSADDAAAAAVKAKIAKALGITVEQVRPAPVSGWYEVQHEHDFAYVSTDGKYLMQGELVDIDTGERLTETRRRVDRLAALKTLGADNTIEFAPPPPMVPKYTVTVFTDLDCPYCRKFHSQIAQYNAKGIAVRYIFFPRHGIGSPTYNQAISVWCSNDRQAALTKAKLGDNLPQRKCDNPVAKEYQLAIDLGIAGTPGLILPDGTLYPGYAAPDELLDLLVKSDAEAKAAVAGSSKTKS
jgi:thiol:disulfide interchange protein DsbC